MKATALCRGSLLWIQMLLIARDQHCCSAEGADGRFLLIDPNRLQFFESEFITFSCMGFGDITKWRVMRKLRGVETMCRTNEETFHGPCHIKGAYGVDSGEYWCDANRNMRSTPVKVNITAGSVILVSPSLPVTEGEDVTLSCIHKENSSVVADFYKDGNLTQASHDGTMTIYNVSKSDEGLYKCRIVGAGESPESLLAVQVSAGSNPPPSHPSSVTLYEFIIRTSVVLAGLLLGLGLCSCLEYRALITTVFAHRRRRIQIQDRVLDHCSLDEYDLYSQAQVHPSLQSFMFLTEQRHLTSCRTGPAHELLLSDIYDDLCITVLWHHCKNKTVSEK